MNGTQWHTYYPYIIQHLSIYISYSVCINLLYPNIWHHYRQSIFSMHYTGLFPHFKSHNAFLSLTMTHKYSNIISPKVLGLMMIYKVNKILSISSISCMFVDSLGLQSHNALYLVRIHVSTLNRLGDIFSLLTILYKSHCSLPLADPNTPAPYQYLSSQIYWNVNCCHFHWFIWVFIVLYAFHSFICEHINQHWICIQSPVAFPLEFSLCCVFKYSWNVFSF